MREGDEPTMVELGRRVAVARHRLFEFREEPLPRCPHGVPCPCGGCGEPTTDDQLEHLSYEGVTGTMRVHYCDHCGWGGCSVEHPVSDDAPDFWQDIEDELDLRALDDDRERAGVLLKRIMREN